MKTKKEIEAIYNEICKTVNGICLYHDNYLVSTANWNSDESYLSFTVYEDSDQDDGADWENDWGIDREGRIYEGETIHNSLEDFKNSW